MALRGFHHYKYKKEWTPKVGEKLLFLQEPENHVDRCAVAAVKITTEGCLSKLQKVVGHVPLEISRHLFLGVKLKVRY